MNRICSIIIILAAVIVMGCTQVKTAESPKLEDATVMQSDYQLALELLEEEVKGNVGVEGVGALRLDKISERYYLGGYSYFPVFPKTNLGYIIIDLQSKEVKPIELNYAEYIEDVYIDGDIIRFFYAGENILNGFKAFPYEIQYNVENDELKRIDNYITMDRWSKHRMGNGVNKVGIGDIIESDGRIEFEFKEIEGTILAGGNICPNIIVGNTLDGEIYIDFENTYLDDDSRKQIKELESKEFIEKIEMREYKNPDKGNNTVVYITPKGIKDYIAEFSDGSFFSNFVLILRFE